MGYCTVVGLSGQCCRAAHTLHRQMYFRQGCSVEAGLTGSQLLW